MKTHIQNATRTAKLRNLAEAGSDTISKVLKTLEITKESTELLDSQIKQLQNSYVSIGESVSTLLNANIFEKEEITSYYEYVSGYQNPKRISDQCDIIKAFLPSIESAKCRIPARKLPSNSEGWFAIPKWQCIASTYTEAVKILTKAICISQKRSMYIPYGYKMTESNLRRTPKTVHFLTEIGKIQHDSDILVIPAQFGKKHRGRSTRRTSEVMLQNEFGLGAFEVGIMLLTHPERLLSHKDLTVLCPGDEYDYWDMLGYFNHVPLYQFHNRSILRETCINSRALPYEGSATAFLL